MVLQALTIDPSNLIGSTGEMTRTISSPAINTAYYLPSATVEGTDWISALEFIDKTFFVRANQALLVEIYNSEDGGVSFQIVQGLSIPSASFILTNWNSVDTSLKLNLVQVKITTQATAPTTIVVTARFGKP